MIFNSRCNPSGLRRKLTFHKKHTASLISSFWIGFACNIWLVVIGDSSQLESKVIWFEIAKFDNITNISTSGSSSVRLYQSSCINITCIAFRSGHSFRGQVIKGRRPHDIFEKLASK